MNRIDRISALLVQLQSRPLVRAQQMAQRFGVSLRTIYRDIRTLSEAGVPICGDAGVGYSLVEGYRLPPLMFTKEEAVAFLTAEKFIEQLTDSQNSGYFHQGMDKVRAVLRAIDKDYLVDMGGGIEIYSNQKLPRSKLPNLLQVMLGSVADKRAVSMNYFTPSRNEQNNRLVEPVGVIYIYPFWHLYAYCHLRGEYRDFRMDRIQQVTPTEQPFRLTHPPLKTLLEKEDNSQLLTEVIVHTTAETSLKVGNTKYFLGLISESQQGQRVVLTFMTYSVETMTRWVLSNADTMKVISPAEINEKLKQILKKIEL